MYEKEMCEAELSSIMSIPLSANERVSFSFITLVCSTTTIQNKCIAVLRQTPFYFFYLISVVYYSAFLYDDMNEIGTMNADRHLRTILKKPTKKFLYMLFCVSHPYAENISLYKKMR
jgi:hypothetical protein